MYIVLKSTTIGETSETVTTETDDIKEARRRYHNILSGAYASASLKYVLCMVLNDKGATILREEYTEPTEEPEES